MNLVKETILCLVYSRGFSKWKMVIDPCVPKFGVRTLLIYLLPGGVDGSIVVIPSTGTSISIFPSFVRFFFRWPVGFCISCFLTIHQSDKVFFKVNENMCHIQ